MAKPPQAPKPLNLKGTAGNDILQGAALGDTIDGGKGNDTLIGAGGGDTLIGGAGADTFRYLAFADSIASTGIDNIADFSAAAGDKVDLTALGHATLQSSFNPNVFGLQAVFSYDAGLNRTTLSYYDGSSTPVFQLYMAGNVTYSPTAFMGIYNPPTFAVSDASASNEGGGLYFFVTRSGDLSQSGSISYTVNGVNAGSVSFAAGSAEAVIIVASPEDNIVEPNELFAVQLTTNTFGGTYTDATGVGTILDNDAPTEGDDNLVGTAGNDTIYLLGGDDTFDGLAGNDIIYGYAGNDTINGGAGNDTLSGDEDDDILDGGTGSDAVYGNDGNDTVIWSGNWTAGETKSFNGNAGYDILDLSGLNINVRLTGAQLFVGSSSNVGSANAFEYIIGTAFDDRMDFSSPLYWEGGAIALEGGAGNDTLIGGADKDHIYGGIGNDTLSGADGGDMLAGGLGADTFRYSSVSDSGVLTMPINMDVIADFNSADGDKFDFSLIDSNPELAGHQGWFFNDSGAFRSDLSDQGKGQLVLIDQGNGTYTLTAYLMGNGDEDMSVYVSTTITASDFIGDVVPAPPPPPVFSIDDITVSEGQYDNGNGETAFTVTRSGDLGAASSVLVSFTPITAIEGSDYYPPLTVQVSFLPGEATATGYIALSADNVAGESPETIALTLSNPVNGVIGDGSAVLTILDNTFPTDFSDNLVGTEGDDTIDLLGGQIDQYFGLGGNDTIMGGNGNDFLHGGDGNDTITGGSGNNAIWGDDGNDTAIFAGAFANYSITLQPDMITVRDNATTYADGLMGIETVLFADGTYDVASGSFNTIDGDELPNDLLGTQYNDTINGFGGVDTLQGFEGDDYLDGGDGNDFLYGGDGDDTLFGDVGGDVQTGGAGADSFVYSAFVESPWFGGDTIYDFNPGEGDVIDLTALGSFNLVPTWQYGLGQQATMTYNGNGTLLQLYADDGSYIPDSTIFIRGGDFRSGDGILGLVTTLPTVGFGSDFAVNEDAGTISVTIYRSGDLTQTSFINWSWQGGSADDGDDFTPGYSGLVEFATGQSEATFTFDIIDDATQEAAETVNFFISQSNAIIGDSQTIVTINDNDLPPPVFTINNVTASEGDGTMTLTVTRTGDLSQASTVEWALGANNAGTGMPFDYYWNGWDTNVSRVLTFAAGVATQIITFNIVDDNSVEGGDGFQIFLQNATNGTITQSLGSGRATITDNDAPTSGNDNLVGTEFNDTINLLDGNDTYSGLGGNDVITGGLGGDILDGGLGNDVFVYNSVSESSPSLGSVDEINDFVRGSDLIDLSGIDANALTPIDDAFTYIGNNAFTNVAGQLRVQTPSQGEPGNLNIVQGDVNGDGIADFAIVLWSPSSTLDAPSVSNFII